MPLSGRQGQPDFAKWLGSKSRSERKEYVVVAEFRAHPERNSLRTPSGRIDPYSDEIARFAYDDCPPHPA